MIKLTTLLLMICSISFGQINVKDANGIAQTIYTKSQVDIAISKAVNSAIANYAKQQSNVDANQNIRLGILMDGDTIFYDKKYLPVIGRTVYFNVDSVLAQIKYPPPPPPVDLNPIATLVNSINDRLVLLEKSAAEIRLNSLEGWRTLTNTDIANLKIAVAKIPTTAVSTSNSTTITTTTTILK